MPQSFLPGAAWTGNRRGRPKKGHAQAELLRAELAKPHEGPADGSPGQTRGERLAQVFVDLALAGNLEAYRLILDRTEGAVPRPPPPGVLTIDHERTGSGDERTSTHLELPDDTVAAVFAYLAARAAGQRALGGDG